MSSARDLDPVGSLIPSPCISQNLDELELPSLSERMDYRSVHDEALKDEFAKLRNPSQAEAVWT